MSELIKTLPEHALCSGELFHKICKEGQSPVYQFLNGKRGFWVNVHLQDNGWYYSSFRGDTSLRPFDMGGLFHVMNEPGWSCVVFTNYWHAYAYELKLKSDQPENHK